jgi:hypothetical protein
MSIITLNRPSLSLPVPVGSKLLIPSASPVPANYLAMNGQTVDAGAYSALAAANIFPNALDSYTKVLLHFDGTNGSTTFTDSASHAFTLIGSPTISTAQSKFGGASMAAASGNSITCTSADFAVGTGDFTFEGWYYLLTRSTDRGFFNLSNAIASVNEGIGVSANYGTDTLAYLLNNSYNGTSTNLSQNTWYHIALTRASGTCKLFANGTQAATWSDTTNYTDTVLKVGSYYGATWSTQGYVDEFRFSKGIARYTANFTPPASVFNSVLTITNTSAPDPSLQWVIRAI